MIAFPLSRYHNYFCPSNNYTAEFDFVQSFPGSTGQEHFAQVVPWQSRDLYAKIMAQGKQQGMAAFEVDYEVTDTSAFPQFKQNVSWASDWLTGMAAAAEEAAIPVLYCMSTPRHLLQSLMYPSVTAARDSVDFAQDGGGNLERVGYNSMLFWAVGLRPSKDGLWTTGPTQPDDEGGYAPRQTDRHPNPEIHVRQVSANISLFMTTLRWTCVGIRRLRRVLPCPVRA